MLRIHCEDEAEAVDVFDGHFNTLIDALRGTIDDCGRIAVSFAGLACASGVRFLLLGCGLGRSGSSTRRGPERAIKAEDVH